MLILNYQTIHGIPINEFYNVLHSLDSMEQLIQFYTNKFLCVNTTHICIFI